MTTFTTAEVNGWFQTINGLPAGSNIASSTANLYVSELNATPPTATPEEIANNLENFPNMMSEALFYRTTVAGFVLREFQAAWGVVPTTGAGSVYDNWVARCLADPTNISAGMSQALAGTSQFMALYGTTSATELATASFVTQLWSNTIGTGGPGPGAMMNVGLPVWQVLQNFVQSAGFVSRMEAPTVNFQDLLLADQTPTGSIFTLPTAPPFAPIVGQTLTLTPGVDTPTTGFTTGNGATATAANSTFVALPGANPPLGVTNTLNAGDVLLTNGAAAGATTLNYTATGGIGVLLSNAPFATDVATTGVNQLNITNNAVSLLGAQAAGFSGNITGLLVENNNSSAAPVTLGETGQGLNTLLTNININGYSGGVGTVANAVILAGAGDLTKTINVGTKGNLGNTGAGLAVQIAISNDVGGERSPVPTSLTGPGPLRPPTTSFSSSTRAV